MMYHNEGKAEKSYYGEDIYSDPANKEIYTRLKDNCKYYNEEDFQAPNKLFSKSFVRCRSFMKEIYGKTIEIVEKSAGFEDCLSILSAYAK